MRHACLFLIFSAVFLLNGGTGFANDPLAQIPVAERRFNSFEPKGLNIGKAILFPALTAETTYTTNVFLQNQDKQADTILSVRPAISGYIPMGNHRIAFDGMAEQRRYADFDSQNHTDYSGRLNGQFAIGTKTALHTRINIERQHQDRLNLSAADIPNRPLAMDRKGFLTELILKPSRIEWRLHAGITDTRYEDGTSLAGGTDLIYRDRDRVNYEAGIKTVFNMGTRWKPFLGFSFNRAVFERRDYIAGSGFTGVKQDSNRYTAHAGFKIEPTDKLRGEMRFGYGYELPDDSALDNGATGLVDIDLTYLYSPLTNFNISASRFFSDDTNATQSIIETRLSASIIQELTRQWILQAGIDYRMREFQNTTEEDNTIGGFLSADYKMNERIRLGAEATHLSRESNRHNGDVDETRALIRVKTDF